MKHETVSEDTIRLLVDRFYARVRDDDLLAPIFEAAIGDHWDRHLPTMYRFWSSVMLRSGQYKGNPVSAHLRLPGVEPHLFDRWLALFDATSEEVFFAPVAGLFQDKARRIAESLQLALFGCPELRVRSARSAADA